MTIETVGVQEFKIDSGMDDKEFAEVDQTAEARKCQGCGGCSGCGKCSGGGTGGPGGNCHGSCQGCKNI